MSPVTLGPAPSSSGYQNHSQMLLKPSPLSSNAGLFQNGASDSVEHSGPPKAPKSLHEVPGQHAFVPRRERRRRTGTVQTDPLSEQVLQIGRGAGKRGWVHDGPHFKINQTAASRLLTLAGEKQPRAAREAAARVAAEMAGGWEAAA